MISKDYIKKKRSDYINWDDYFMSIALLSAKRSKDPITQVGACVVSSKNRIVGIGYNGFPYGCSDDKFPWDKNGPFIKTKYAYVCHAELNAVINSSIENLGMCSIYCVLFPCNECTKVIIQSGIKEIIYLFGKYSNKESIQASKEMLHQSNVTYRQLKPHRGKLVIDFKKKL